MDMVGRDELCQFSGIDFPVFALDGHGVDHVLQLSYVSGPRVLQQQFSGILRQSDGRYSKAFLVFKGEFAEYQVNVLAAFPEWGDVQVDDRKTVVEVFAEPPVGNCLPHVAVCGGDNPDVCLSDLARAYRQEFVRFKHAEQADLHLQGQFAHLVEEERSAIGGGKVAFAVLHASCICPLDMSEEFAFDGSFGNGAAVDRQVFPVGTWAEVVDDARDDFLSHTVFALYQYGKV